MDIYENYKKPESEILDPSKKKDDIREILTIAKRQKALLYTFLAYILLPFFLAFMGAAAEPAAPFLYLFIIIAILFFTARLSLKLYGKIGSTVITILMIIPLINLLALLRVNAKANDLIKGKGFRVGLIGANIKIIEGSIKN